MENAGPDSRGTGCAVSGYGKRGFERNYDSDMLTFRNCDVKRVETLKGDIRSPLTGPHSCATFVVNLKKGGLELGVRTTNIVFMVVPCFQDLL